MKNKNIILIIGIIILIIILSGAKKPSEGDYGTVSEESAKKVYMPPIQGVYPTSYTQTFITVGGVKYICETMPQTDNKYFFITDSTGKTCYYNHDNVPSVVWQLFDTRINPWSKVSVIPDTHSDTYINEADAFKYQTTKCVSGLTPNSNDIYMGYIYLCNIQDTANCQDYAGESIASADYVTAGGTKYYDYCSSGYLMETICTDSSPYHSYKKYVCQEYGFDKCEADGSSAKCVYEPCATSCSISNYATKCTSDGIDVIKCMPTTPDCWDEFIWELCDYGCENGACKSSPAPTGKPNIINYQNPDISVINGKVKATFYFKNTGVSMDKEWLIEIEPKRTGGLMSAFVSAQKTCNPSYPSNVHKTYKLASGESTTIVLEAPIGESGTYDITAFSTDKCCVNPDGTPADPFCDLTISAPYAGGTVIKTGLQVTTTTVPVCGDQSCGGSENYLTCPGDCISWCGDNLCDNSKETSSNCPGDCKVAASKAMTLAEAESFKGDISGYSCDNAEECPVNTVCFLVKEKTIIQSTVFGDVISDLLTKAKEFFTTWTTKLSGISTAKTTIDNVIDTRNNILPLVEKTTKIGVCISDWKTAVTDPIQDALNKIKEDDPAVDTSDVDDAINKVDGGTSTGTGTPSKICCDVLGKDPEWRLKSDCNLPYVHEIVDNSKCPAPTCPAGQKLCSKEQKCIAENEWTDARCTTPVVPSEFKCKTPMKGGFDWECVKSSAGTYAITGGSLLLNLISTPSSIQSCYSDAGQHCAISMTKKEFSEATDAAISLAICDISSNCEPYYEEGYSVKCVNQDTADVRIGGAITGLGSWLFGTEEKGVCLARPEFDLFEWLEDTFGVAGTTAWIVLIGGVLLIVFVLNMLLTPRK